MEVIFLRAIKSINHNAAICVDGNGREVITFGKGIGFPAMPYEITDLKVIKRTYYNISSHLIGLINEINEEIFDVSAAIVDQAKGMLKCQLNPNLVFSLADHINFAIKRQKEYGNVKLLFSYDIEQLYPKETKLGQYAVKLIRKKLLVNLPDGEATSIALHFINAEQENGLNDATEYDTCIEKMTEIVEEHFQIQIERESFNYYRFTMHMRYFLKRLIEGEQFIDKNTELLEWIRREYMEINLCTKKIENYLRERYHTICTDEEVLYIMVHINRICV